MGENVSLSSGSRACLRRLAREPFLQFVLLGAVLFGAQRWLAPPEGNEIVLAEPVVRSLREERMRRTGVPPTAEEEAALIQRVVDDEVLYREALALGLDQGDLIIRRRLVQKMQFLNESLEPVPEPTEDQLQSYLEQHAERYAAAERVAFVHVFASRRTHGEDAPRVAAHWREQLREGVAAEGLGDPFLHGRRFPLRTRRELSGTFGPAFAERVMSLEPDDWSEPIRSSYGWHLVRVTEHAPARVPDLDEARTMVRRDWQEERRAEINRTIMERLRARYEVRVETPKASEDKVAATR